MQISKKAMTFVVAIFAVLATAAAQDTGNATYYADYFHGRKASDGTLYHRDSMTCAHKTYPFGTVLRVRNQKNGNEVYVTVTDRGPFRRGCIVDLSYAAATQLDMISAGVVPVEVEIIEPVVPFRKIEHHTPLARFRGSHRQKLLLTQAEQSQNGKTPQGQDGQHRRQRDK